MAQREKTVELVPQAPSARADTRAPRVVGPGRRERGYLTRLENLEQRLSLSAEEQRRMERELETSVRLEHGCQRLIDRMEVSWSEDRKRLDSAQAQQKRLILTLGALQRENELLRERLELAAAPPAARIAGPEPKLSDPVSSDPEAAPDQRPADVLPRARRTRTSSSRGSWLGRLFGSGRRR